jgi:hypothetical protein
MYPFLKPGDVLILSPVGARDVERGDIICVTHGRRYITHRVVTILDKPPAAILTTKGDNLPHPDRPLPPNSESILKVIMVVRSRGRLVRPRFGKALAFLSGNNLSPGIIQGRIGRIVRGLYGRFRIFLSKESSRP